MDTLHVPNRALFKAAEVCEIAALQPYVLRSWEAEFPELGVARDGTRGRVYRRADVERVLRIKHLLVVEGLTLAGIRRRMDEEAAPAAADEASLAALFDRNARERLAAVRQGLRGILDLLSDRPPAGPGSGNARPQAVSREAVSSAGRGRRAVSTGGSRRATGPQAKAARRKSRARN